MEKICSNCKKKDPFQVVCNYKKRIEREEGTDPPTENAEICTIKTPIKNREEIKLNDLSFHMKVDTGSNVTLIRRNFVEKMRKQRLRKSYLQLKQFDRNGN